MGKYRRRHECIYPTSDEQEIGRSNEHEVDLMACIIDSWVPTPLQYGVGADAFSSG
jgi:hypothetical protein